MTSQRKALHHEAMRFHEKLQKLMDAEELDPSKLGRKVKVSHTTVANWLKGSEPSLWKAAKVASHFGVSLDYLTDDSQHYPPPQDVTPEERMLLRMMREAGISPETVGAMLLPNQDASIIPSPTQDARPKHRRA